MFSRVLHYIKSITNDKPLPLKVWQQLDTKYQWPVGTKEEVEVIHRGITYHGFIFAVDLYSVMLYDRNDILIGTFPKETMTRHYPTYYK